MTTSRAGRRPTSLLPDLAAAVGATHVLTDPALTFAYTSDWTGRWSGRALAVVRPGSTEEVSAVLRLCQADGVPVVVQGGNTGLAGGAVPYDAVVLSTRRLDTMGSVDLDARAITAGAGATVAAVQAAARPAGLRYGVDLASRDSATIGGTVATNAGGVRVCAFGSTRAQVLGVQAVLADGSVLTRLDGPVKDSTGYDLGQLLVGSEGTLAVVTAVRVQLRPPLPATRMTALLPVDGVADALAALRSARAGDGSQEPVLLAAEYVERTVLELTGGPVGAPAQVLVEGVGLALPDNAIVALDESDRARLWSFREGATEAVSRVGVPHKLDVSLPLATLADFLDALPGVLAPEVRTFVWAHLAEGNVHVNLIGSGGARWDSDFTADEAVLRAVAEHGGSVSGEHGIGRAKVAWLGLTRSAVEIATMRAIKAALDPTGLLNPGVLLG